jgi:hypothetical protein
MSITVVAGRCAVHELMIQVPESRIDLAAP